MTRVACLPCGLRFAPSSWSLCPECERPLTTLGSAEEAVGLQLFTPPEVSLAAIAAAIADRPETWPPPRS